MFQTTNRVFHSTKAEAEKELKKKKFVLVDKRNNHWMGDIQGAIITTCVTGGVWVKYTKPV